MSDNEKRQGTKGTVFFVGEEKFRTEADTLTVRVIITDFAKEDPTKVTLVERKGNELIKHTELDKAIEMKNGMKFIIYFNDPTPVS